MKREIPPKAPLVRVRATRIGYGSDRERVVSYSVRAKLDCGNAREWPHCSFARAEALFERLRAQGAQTRCYECRGSRS